MEGKKNRERGRLKSFWGVWRAIHPDESKCPSHNQLNFTFVFQTLDGLRDDKVGVILLPTFSKSPSFFFLISFHNPNHIVQ